MLTLFFGKDGMLVGSDLVVSDSTAHVVIRPVALLRKANLLRARSLVLAHNHPGGRAAPSRADICSTVYLDHLAGQHGLRLAEHFIVGSEGIFSMRRARLLP